ncbi:hypothetical protein SeMB42_g00657 [Synchytrium endobioticum]|uniref:General negative regulator of transcription subunit n=1 Tax=Synchytrium endobioticum TaxID=286115 RepID=A0A507DPW0_9FUNG|nr:hypothetical protein SeLEV6574_g03798 [Synchytrium endobioticum]TPX53633.1 hypothetical protein SeMB42_g00657 [Synchytrium endobioticum]
MSMAARKLQTEIEKTLKKVAEGIEIFESIYEKILTATNAAQKEKFEGDLKKEIKKLQRYRDTIKGWLSSNEIKDKRALLDNRKLIESQMEKFKAMEKELKTKAFSKEGLSLPGKVDPEEAKRENLADWIRRTVESLQEMIDKLEFEQEQLLSTIKKTKKVDPTKQERLTSVEHLLERHKWHINKLEIILRLLENGNLTFDQVKSIQDDVSFYVESCEEDDFEEDEGIYDELNLEEAQLYGLPADEDEDGETHSGSDLCSPKDKECSPEISPTAPPRDDRRKSSKDPDVDTFFTPTKSKPGTRDRVNSKDEGKLKLITSAPSTPAASSRSGGTTTGFTPSSTTRTPISQTATGPAPRDVVPPIQRYAAAASSNTAIQATPSAAVAVAVGVNDKQSPLRGSHNEVPSIVPAAASLAAVTSNKHQTSETSPSIAAKTLPKESSTPLVTSPTSSMQPSAPTAPITIASRTSGPSGPVTPTQTPVTCSNAIPTTQTTPSVPSSTTPTNGKSRQPSPTAQTPPISVATNQQPVSQQILQKLPTSPEAPKDEQTVETVDKRLSDLVDSFEATKARSLKAQTDPGFIHTMMETSFHFVPDASDSEKAKYYTPKNPYPTPGYYPQTPLALLGNSTLFEKFDIDTLFFIFYYQQGTHQQYLAARELKRQSWRFHKKYLTWFQRHEEPKSITDEYEQGTYIYFDYEGAWCQRKKCEFRFDYRYLEDAELA